MELWQDQLAGDISQEEEMELMQLLDSHPEIRKELSELEQTWQLFEEIERPEPSEQMDARFEGMLAGYKATRTRNQVSVFTMIQAFLSRNWQVGLASLVLGVFVGWWLLPDQNQSSLNELSSEIQGMKEMMMLTLIEQPKAQERIRAVNMAAELPNADDKVIQALITTLNHDENVNVRLAALESLLKYGDLPNVRHALIDALKMQDSPLMLVAIADALVIIQEKESIETMERLRDTIDDELVKDKLEESIQSLTQI